MQVVHCHQYCSQRGVPQRCKGKSVWSRFWVAKGRLKKINQQCTLCHYLEGPHFDVPPPSPLPKYQVSEFPLFTAMNVDFAGLLYVRYHGGMGTHKVWLCLFTCSIVHAVHLDLVPDMMTTAFLRCLKWYLSWREIPRFDCVRHWANI